MRYGAVALYAPPAFCLPPALCAAGTVPFAARARWAACAGPVSEIRRARPAEALRVAAMVRAAFQPGPPRGRGPLDALGALQRYVEEGELAAQFAKRARVDASRHALLLALRGPARELVGCVEIGALHVPAALARPSAADVWGDAPAARPGSARTPYIGNLAVVRAARRQGVASTLVDAAEATARAWGAPQVVLHVDAANVPAQRLYMRRGYACSIREPEWYPAVGRAQRLFLVKELEPHSEPLPPQGWVGACSGDWESAPVRHTRKLGPAEYIRWCIYDLQRVSR